MPPACPPFSSAVSAQWVAGNVTVESGGTVAAEAGASLAIAGTLTVQPNATLVLRGPAAGTAVLATFAAGSGSFAAVQVEPPDGCATAVASLGTQALSVTVTFSCLSAAATIAVAVSCAVAGIAVVLVVAVVTRRRLARRDLLENMSLRGEDLAQLDCTEYVRMQ